MSSYPRRLTTSTSRSGSPPETPGRWGGPRVRPNPEGDTFISEHILKSPDELRSDETLFARVGDVVRRQPLAAFFVLAFAYSWLQSAGASLLIAMVFHAMNNAVSGEYFSQLFDGAASTRQSWMLVVVWSIAAVAVLAFARHFRTRREGT
jgi:hypothetical protein